MDAQAAASKKNGYRLPFKACPSCGDRQLYKSYQPNSSISWAEYCWTCSYTVPNPIYKPTPTKEAPNENVTTSA